MKKYFVLVFLLVTPLLLPAPLHAQTCPEGYTCPDTAPVPIPGEKIHYEEDVSSIPGGPTGPDTNQLKVPQLDEENKYYNDQELQYRALPSSLKDQLEFKPADLEGKISHAGCGDSFVDGKNSGRADLAGRKRTTDFNTTQGYDNLLTVSRFWQAIFVPQKATSLKIASVQPLATPEPPTSLAGCTNDSGSTFEPLGIQNSEPPPLGFLGNIIQAFVDAINSLFCPFDPEGKITGKKCTFHVAMDIQQLKLIPGEGSFNDQTVGNNGFVNFFKPKTVPFTKDGTERDQDEKVSYKVLNQDRPVGGDKQVGVTYEGMSSFQAGSIDMVRAMYPAQFASSIQSLPDQNNTESGVLNYTLPYRDTSVAVDKDRIIRLVKQFWPDSPIDQLFDTVVQRALEAGINPAFALAIWIEESGASSPRAKAQSAFGCFPGGDTNQWVTFDRSLNCFIGFTNDHPNDFYDWMRFFCGPGTPSVCSNNRYFAGNLKKWYDDVVRH